MDILSATKPPYIILYLCLSFLFHSLSLTLPPFFTHDKQNPLEICKDGLRQGPNAAAIAVYFKVTMLHEDAHGNP